MADSETLSIRCPFTARPLKARKAGGVWYAASEGADDGFFTSLFPGKGELVLWLVKTFKMPKAGEPATKPLLKCPVYGKPVTLKEVTGGRWIGVSYGKDGRGYTTRSFWDRRRLEYFLSTRAGVPPVFGPSALEVVGDRKPPVVDEYAKQANERLELVKGAANEAIEKAGLDLGILAPRPTVVKG